MNEKERNRIIAEELRKGATLSDVQKTLADEHEVSLTYLELRLISADLKVDWKKQDKAKAKKKTPKPKGIDLAEDAGSASRTATEITVSKIVRPGAAMSGTVTFASGTTAEWYVDAMGRLGLNQEEGAAKPTPEDIKEFQEELKKELSGS